MTIRRSSNPWQTSAKSARKWRTPCYPRWRRPPSRKVKKNGIFVIPGIGRLVRVDRKARMGRNPATGETIKIAAKKVGKFRIAKAAKDAIVPPKSKKATLTSKSPEPPKAAAKRRDGAGRESGRAASPVNL